MPKIPEFSGRTQVVADRPPGVDINPNSYGRSEEAVGRVGSLIGNFGADLMEKRRAAEDTHFSNSTMLQDLRDVEAYKEQLKMTVGADYKGYTDKIQEFVNSRMEKSQAAAPSERARMMYSESASTRFTSQLIDANSTEHMERAKYYGEDVDKNIQMNSDSLVSYPSVSGAYEKIDTMNSWIDQQTGTVFSPALSTEKKKVNGNQAALSVMKGLYNHALRDHDRWETISRQAEDVLNGTDTESQLRPKDKQIGNLLLPGQKAQIIEDFIRLRKDRTRTSVAELNRMSADAVEGAYNGKARNTAVGPAWDRAIGLGATEPEAKLRFTTEQEVARLAGNVRRGMARSNPENWVGMIDSLGNEVERAKADRTIPAEAATQSDYMEVTLDQWKRKLESETPGLQRELKEDPAAYVNKYFPNVSRLSKESFKGPQQTTKYITANLAAQRSMGVPEHQLRYLSKSETAGIARMIGAGDEKNGSDQYTRLQELYGPYWNQVHAQAVADKSLTSDHFIVGNMEQPFDRQTALAMIRNADPIKKAFGERYDSKAEADLKTTVREQIEPFRRAVSNMSVGGGAENFANSFENMVMLKAMQEKNRTDMDSSEAVSRAMRMITNTFHVANGGAGLLLMPKQIDERPVNKDAVEAFVSSHMNPAGLDTLRVQLPGGRAWLENLTPDERKSNFYSQVQKTGVWVYDGKASMRLMYDDPERGPQYVLDSRRPMARKGPKGETFYEALTVPIQNVPMDDLTRDAIRGFWGKTKERAGAAASSAASAAGTVIEGASKGPTTYPGGKP